LNCGRELSVASTKAFISQVTVLTLVALWFAHRRSYKQTKAQRASITKELRFLSGNLQTALDNSVDFSKYAVDRLLKGHKHLYLLGSGLGDIAAKEGALKIKELTYLHCQAINLANISNGGFFNYIKSHSTPMIFVILEKNSSQSVEGDIAIMKVMQERLGQQIAGKSIVITDVRDREVKQFFEGFTGDPKLVH